jgi:hypothetical protein
MSTATRQPIPKFNSMEVESAGLVEMLAIRRMIGRVKLEVGERPDNSVCAYRHQLHEGIEGSIKSSHQYRLP